MEALVQAIVARCTTLVDGLALDDPNTENGTVAVQVFPHALPIADNPGDKAEQVPSVVVRLVGIEEASGKVNPIIRVLGEIHTADGVAEGMADLLILVNRLRPLSDRGPGNIANYKLIPPVVWQIGDKETGNQPHPFYQFQADLRFSGV
jgi:hypothetical protein